MSYYMMIEDNKIIGVSCCESGGNIVDIEISEEVYNTYKEDNDKYIWDGSNIIENPNYDEIKRQKEQTMIDNLTMTPLDFIGVLQSLGLTLQQITDFLDEHLEIKTQLTYCNSVYCGVVKSFLPITVNDITITSNMVERAFKLKNGVE